MEAMGLSPILGQGRNCGGGYWGTGGPPNPPVFPPPQCIYKQFDTDRSGTIGVQELPGAFEAAGLGVQ